MKIFTLIILVYEIELDKSEDKFWMSQTYSLIHCLNREIYIHWKYIELENFERQLIHGHFNSSPKILE